MTTILMVRHGESLSNHDHLFAGGRSDVALRERGLQQAELTAAFVAENYRVTRVYSSPLQRAWVTGKCVADRFGLDVIVRQALTEIDGGLWEGMSFAHMEQWYPEEFRLWVTDYGHAACPGGESVSQVASRILAEMTKIAEENPDTTVLVATHGAPVRVMLGLTQNGGLENLNRIPWPSNASVTVLTYDAGRWSCTAASLDAHLGALKTALPKNV